MKAVFILIQALFLLTTMLNAGTMQIQPAMPKRGIDTVVIQYTASKASLAKAKKIYAIIHNYTARDKKPYAVQYALESFPTAKSKDSLSFTAKFVLKTDASLILIKVGDGAKYSDNNSGNYWELLPLDKDGKIPEGQSLRRIISYSESFPEECARKQNIALAMEILQNNKDYSLTIFQKNFFQRILPFMAKQIDRDSLKKSMSAFLTQNGIDTESEAENRMLTQALRITGNSEMADSVEKQYEYLHPLDEFSEEASANRVFSSKTKDEFIVNAEKYINQYPSSYSILSIAESYIRVQLKEGKLAMLTERFLRDPTLPTTPSLDLANTFLELDSLKEALRWAERAVFFAKDEASVVQPKYLAQCEFAEERRKVIAEAMMAPAFVYKRMKNHEKSLQLYKEVAEGYADKLDMMQMTSVYQSMIELLDALSNQQEAYALASKAISSGYMSDKILSDHKALFEYLSKQDLIKGEYETEITELKNTGLKAKQQLILEDQLSLPPVPGILKTADGKTITPDDWKGKVVFIDFWATWCGPCIRSFPGLQKLYDKYKSNPDVIFAVVNVWERVEDRFASVKTFLSKNPYTFPILFDLKDEMVKGYGVTGIPSKFILDKNGIGRFMEVGLAEEQTFIDQTSMKIDALLAQ
jgi:thiol-disulfide isomerase/thioredoxin